MQVEKAGRVPDRFSIHVQGEILTAELVRKDRQQVAVTFIDPQTLELRPKTVQIASPYQSVALLRASLRRRALGDVLKEQALRVRRALVRSMAPARFAPASQPVQTSRRIAG
jgi:hypothetical protein